MKKRRKYKRNDCSRAERFRVFEVFAPFAKSIAAGYVLFCVPKENQKTASDFDALDPRKMGYAPLLTPKQLGSIQKIQVAALKDFLCCADL